MILKDRWALVTGATGGVGRTVATALAQAGAGVILSARDAARLAHVEGQIRASGGRARIHAADLAVDEQIDALAAAVGDATPALGALVHCAGWIRPGLLPATELSELDAQLQVNLRAPLLLTRALLPLLREAQGDVVFLNSTAGLSAPPGAAAYASAKHGLRGLADGLRAEVNAEGIRVVSLFLGRTATPMQESVHAFEGRPYRPGHLIQPGDVATLVLAVLRLPRTAEVTEIRVRPMRKPEPRS